MAENIAIFCKKTGGRRSQDAPHSVRRWIGGIIDGILTNWRVAGHPHTHVDTQALRSLFDAIDR